MRRLSKRLFLPFLVLLILGGTGLYTDYFGVNQFIDSLYLAMTVPAFFIAVLATMTERLRRRNDRLEKMIQDLESGKLMPQSRKEISIPKLAELFSYILPRGIKADGFDQSYEDLKEDYLLARKDRKKHPKWMKFAFSCRFLYIWAECMRLAAISVLKKIVPIWGLVEKIREFLNL